MTELCRAFGIARKTGYKWVARFNAEGAAGLEDRSRAPIDHPNAVAPTIEDWITELRRQRPSWGPRKLLAYLERWAPGTKLPSHSTVSRIFRRRGLARSRRRRSRTPAYHGPFSSCAAPNQLWCADFKGWFETGDHKRCYPFTVTDACSRYLIRCEALLRPDFAGTKHVLRSAFEEYGMPDALRTDNGAPFASRAPGGLSQLSIWLIKLGVTPERIEPGKPTQNGRHERMHRTLKAETATPPRRNRLAQQRALDAFQQDFNEVRPHEALGQVPPIEVFQRSRRPFPWNLADPNYPDEYELFRVRGDGTIRWHHCTIPISELLAGEVVAIEDLADQGSQVWFGPIAIGSIDGGTGRFKPRK
jgi:putative transposase